MTTDEDILGRISRLVDEEHQLENQPDGADADRLRALEIQLDQCWDLLRQRRARRDAGLNPDDARVRDAATVEGYQQ
ncbi:MAG: DUF2630 family protein [Desertimonas sp.]